MAFVFGRSVATAIVFAFGLQGAAQAQTPPPPPPPAKAVLAPPKPDGKPGSDYLQCDGQPRAIPVAEALGDVALITGSLGLFGLINPIENANVNKRLEGEAGVAACDRAVLGDTTALRRSQLVAARAIHRIEAKQYDAAIADTHLVATTAGDKGSEPGFQESLGLTAMELEAAALVREGKTTEANHVAMAMGLASPYDVNNMARASRFTLLTAEMTPEKAQFLDRLVRLMPQMLTLRCSARELAGDFAGASDDMAAFIDINHGVWPDLPAFAPLVRQSILLAILGDVAQSDALAAKVQPDIDADIRNGKLNEMTASSLQEQLDFRNIVVMVAKGQIADARVAFKSRSRWLAPWPMEIAFVTAKLRDGLAPADITGALAREPDTIKADALATYASDAADAGRPDAEARQVTLYAAVRPYIDPGAYRTMAGAAWDPKSRMLLARTGKEIYQGELMTLNGWAPYQQIVQSEGLVLHAAVVAKARGLTGFIIVPYRSRLDTLTVRFGNAGEPGFPKASFMDADQVIADLSPKMPH